MAREVPGGRAGDRMVEGGAERAVRSTAWRVAPRAEGAPERAGEGEDRGQGDHRDESDWSDPGGGHPTVPSVILTANDDTVNIFLAIYCRRLNPETIIVSRVNQERNIEAIHRAGADFALSDAQLGVQWVMSVLDGRDLVLLGEGLDLFDLAVPRSLAQDAAGDGIPQPELAQRDRHRVGGE